MKKSLDNVEIVEFKKQQRFDSFTPSRSNELAELFRTIDSKISALLADQEFEQRGFCMDNFKNQATMLVNMAEALNIMPVTPDGPKSRLKDASMFMQHLIQDLQREMDSNEPDLRKDLRYTVSLMTGMRYLNKNVIEIVKDINIECFYALKALNDMYTVNSQMLAAKVDKLVDQLKDSVKSELDGSRQIHKPKSGLEEFLHQNGKSEKKTEDPFQGSERSYQEFRSNQDNLFRDNSAPKFKVYASSKTNLNGTMKSQKSAKKLASTRSLSPFLDKKGQLEGAIPLKELKELIEDIKAAKQRYDASCDRKQMPYESLKTFMNIFLKDRYTTSRALKEFMEKFNKSLSFYYKQDVWVQLFRSIYENVIDEEFFAIAADISTKMTTHLEVSLLGIGRSWKL